VQISLTLQDETKVQVMDGLTVLFGKSAPKTVEKGTFDVNVPLTEGDHLIQVLLGDAGGSVQEYTKRFLVDFTPPQLTMIQPQNTHAKLIGDYASGFTDTDSVVLYEGKEIRPDAKGYFKINGVGKSLNLLIKDSHGNETTYHWSSSSNWNWGLTFFIIFNIFMVLCTIAAFIFIRHRRKLK
jgi:hypothetical protein